MDNLKICLIVLIDISNGQDVHSKSILPFLSLIWNEVKQCTNSIKSSFTKDITLGLETRLKSLESILPGQNLYQVFVKRLTRLSDFDNVNEIIKQCLSSPSISPTSPFGQFLRQCHLDISRLQFSSLQHVWSSFLLFKSQLSSNSSTYTYTKRDIDDLSQFQLDKFQSNGCRLSKEVKLKLEEMLQSSNRSADLLFLKFFDSWRSGLYSEAIDCLHQYFDYAMTGYSQQKIKTYHQYALLHLAVLYADFQHYEDSISAMDDCIAAARESQDLKCLNFGLSWLIHLRKANAELPKYEKLLKSITSAENEVDVLAYLHHKSIETKDWTQLSNTLLNQSELNVRNPINITRAFALSYQSFHLNLKHNLESIQPLQTRLHGALFNHIGAQSLSDIYSSIYENIHSRFSSESDKTTMLYLKAYQMVNKGEYNKALQRIDMNDIAKPLTVKLINQQLGISIMMDLKISLYRDHMDHASTLIRKLKTFQSISEPDIAFEAFLLELEYLRKSGNSPKALELINDRVDQFNNSSSTSIINNAQLLIKKAEIYAHTDNSEKGFSIAMRAANIALMHSVIPLLCQAIACIANILNDMEEYIAARELLDAIIPQTLELDDVYLIGKIYSFLTDTYVGEACMFNEKGSKERDDKLNIAQVYLERAKDAYQQMEDLDGILSCLDKKAMLYRYKGDNDLAEEMDIMYEAEIKQSKDKEREKDKS